VYFASRQEWLAGAQMISNKTRKILWGRSGNQCAICRKTLVEDATESDLEAIIGEECHIVSPKNNGPRFNCAFSEDLYDDVSNLVLLCANHHALVDKQPETYTVARLLDIKDNHESSVRKALSDNNTSEPKIVRQKEEIPTYLKRITTGEDLAGIICNACAYEFSNEEPKIPEDIELIASFLQEMQEWGDLYNELEAGDRVRTKYRLSELLRDLEEHGIWVFGAQEKCLLKDSRQSSSFPIAIIKTVYESSSSIEAIP
jgi:hypothetical protein